MSKTHVGRSSDQKKAPAFQPGPGMIPIGIYAAFSVSTAAAAARLARIVIHAAFAAAERCSGVLAAAALYAAAERCSAVRSIVTGATGVAVTTGVGVSTVAIGAGTGVATGATFGVVTFATGAVLAVAFFAKVTFTGAAVFFVFILLVFLCFGVEFPMN